jgi:hypothetical protein
MPPEKLVANTSIPPATLETIAPALTIPPEKVDTRTSIPVLFALIELFLVAVMPPENADSWTKTPQPLDEVSVPLLVIPPSNVDP